MVLAPGGLKSRLIPVSPRRNFSSSKVWIGGVFVAVPRRVSVSSFELNLRFVLPRWEFFYSKLSVFYFREFLARWIQSE